MDEIFFDEFCSETMLDKESDEAIKAYVDFKQQTHYSFSEWWAIYQGAYI